MSKGFRELLTEFMQNGVFAPVSQKEMLVEWVKFGFVASVNPFDELTLQATNNLQILHEGVWTVFKRSGKLEKLTEFMRMTQQLASSGDNADRLIAMRLFLYSLVAYAYAREGSWTVEELQKTLQKLMRSGALPEDYIPQLIEFIERLNA